MCGRFPSTGTFADVGAYLNATVRADDEFVPDHNVAPTKAAPAVIAVEGERRLGTMAWGFDSRSTARPAPVINARVETVATRPLFREAVRRRRAVVVADGYFEWTRTAAGVRQPHFISATERFVTFAALYDTRRDAMGQLAASFVLLTTAADPALAHIHDRRPLVVPADWWEGWLDADTEVLPVLRELASVQPVMQARTVGPLVNNVRNNGPELLAPLPA